ncbi:2OG-Fe dioxygenase family protein [Pseudoalteromonas rubra]|uniref:Fe2OG dioxygenase domain-containing protein n=1 Tax=Pseudoalteromonas rubra TaxID=43658 RepID=A0A5S3WW04_9GAMM|nr:2OG-Fe dioxygenase family protein [Pseudoalteromonas rubra]TMP34748.1 hypothetical protein CWB98_17275 [Pseudoalteromonas rubra]
MLIRELKVPIEVINTADFGVDINTLSATLRNAYEHDYEWDNYLFRQKKIELIKQNLAPEELAKYDENFWGQYYSGIMPDSDLRAVLEKCPPSLYAELDKLKPTRKRLIAEFNITHDGNDFVIKRVPAREFGQEDALTSTNLQDYRLVKRKFKELPDKLDTEYLHKTIKYLANQLYTKLNGQQCNFNIIVHYTLVYCYPEESATNSPEGIHQDGMDYIVSAMVVERNNVEGGKSIIYGSDAKTEVLNTTLQPGMGILQPDRNSDLWHTVTSIRTKNNNETGYRSTIGFDIQYI